MVFDINIFDGMPIGKKYEDGTDILCGDTVFIIEEVVDSEFDYFGNTVNQTRRNREVYGKIAYSETYCGFAFIPEQREDEKNFPCLQVPYVQKMISSYEFKKIYKISYFS